MDSSVVSSYRKFIENYPIVRKFWSTEAPLTMVHGDCHIGNMSFFNNDDKKMWFFDMQCVAAEHCMRDIAYHLIACFNDGELTDEIEEELRSQQANFERDVGRLRKQYERRGRALRAAKAAKEAAREQSS